MSERLQVIKDVILVPGLGDQTKPVKATTEAAAGRLAERGFTTHDFVPDWDNRLEGLDGKRRRLGSLIEQVSDAAGGPVGLIGYSHGGDLALLTAKDHPHQVGSVVAAHARTRFTETQFGRWEDAFAVNHAGADAVYLVEQGWPNMAEVLDGKVATIRVPGADRTVPDIAMQLPGANNQYVSLRGRGVRPVEGHASAIHALLTSYRGVRAVGTLVENPIASVKALGQPRR